MPPKGTGKVVHFDGLPEGWEAVEKVYASGIYAGQTYLRFQSKDGRHKNVGSAKKVVNLDAEERDIDPAEAFAAYEKVREYGMSDSSTRQTFGSKEEASTSHCMVRLATTRALA